MGCYIYCSYWYLVQLSIHIHLSVTIFCTRFQQLLLEWMLRYLVYCESTIVRWVPIFVIFMGRSICEIWFPMKRIFPLMFVLKTVNSRIHKLVFLPLSMKIGIHELKYFHSIAFAWRLVLCLPFPGYWLSSSCLLHHFIWQNCLSQGILSIL